MRASGGETAGAITTSCCAQARLRQHHDTVPYREALVSWLLRERLGQADQNDLIWMPRLVIPEVPPTVQIGRISRDGRGPAVVVERDRNAGRPIRLSAMPGLALDGSRPGPGLFERGHEGPDAFQGGRGLPD